MSQKQLEKWDEEIPSVPLNRVLALNIKEWWMILIGILGAAVTGGILPVLAIPLLPILWRSTITSIIPYQEREASHQISFLFLGLGGYVGAIGVFVKVRCQ